MRTDDIRFLAYDECDRIARENGCRVMRRGVSPVIKSRTDATTTIEVGCYLVDPAGIPEADLEALLDSEFNPGAPTVELDP